MEQNASSEDNGHSASKEIHIFYGIKVFITIPRRNFHFPVPLPNQINPIYIPIALFKFCFQ
jgi:hypothetical protein